MPRDEKVDLTGKTILCTGATGSLGQALVALLVKSDLQKIIVFSRDEFKQAEMKHKWSKYPIRYFLGDVRDEKRLQRAFSGVDYIIHTAALKHVDLCHYNPFEAVQTNVLGAQNIINAAIDQDVKKVIAISSDKAVSPVNIYGATKLCSDFMFIDANVYSGSKGSCFSVVRFGNFIRSRGSVIPYFEEQAKKGESFSITDDRMTRFWISLEKAAKVTLRMLHKMKGGEIFTPKMKESRIIDVAKEIHDKLAKNQEFKYNISGRRPREKIQEELLVETDMMNTKEYDDYYITWPNGIPE